MVLQKKVISVEDICNAILQVYKKYKPDIGEFQTFLNCQTWRKDVWFDICSIIVPNLRDVRTLKSYSQRCYGSYKYNEDKICSLIRINLRNEMSAQVSDDFNNQSYSVAKSEMDIIEKKVFSNDFHEDRYSSDERSSINVQYSFIHQDTTQESFSNNDLKTIDNDEMADDFSNQSYSVAKSEMDTIEKQDFSNDFHEDQYSSDGRLSTNVQYGIYHDTIQKSFSNSDLKTINNDEIANTDFFLNNLNNSNASMKFPYNANKWTIKGPQFILPQTFWIKYWCSNQHLKNT